MDGREDQKGKRKDGEVEWSLTGRERGKTEVNHIFLRDFVCLWAKAGLLQDLVTENGTKLGMRAFSQSTHRTLDHLCHW